MVQNLFILLPLIMVIVVALEKVSSIGCLLLLTTILVMYLQKDTYWEYTFQSIGVATSIAMIIVYALYILYLSYPDDNEYILRFGMDKEIEGESDEYTFLLNLSIIMVGCVVQKSVFQYKQYFQ